MWAEVGRHLPAVGPWDVVIILAVPVIAVLGTMALLHMVSKNPKSEGEIHIRPLGIEIRWSQSQNLKAGKPQQSVQQEVQGSGNTVVPSSVAQNE
jgi:hypothetical protein